MLLFAILATLAAFILMILLHEYGHAWAAKRAGLDVRRVHAGNGPAFRFRLSGVEHRIGLIPFSGKCVIPDLYQAPASTRVLIAAAGPVASLVVGAALYLAGLMGDSTVLQLLGKASVAMTVCNLLPIPGLDGWVMLKSFRESRTKCTS